jgi:hypothetical protein
MGGSCTHEWCFGQTDATAAKGEVKDAGDDDDEDEDEDEPAAGDSAKAGEGTTKD